MDETHYYWFADLVYKKEHYNSVLNAIIESYGLNVAKIPDWTFAAWRSATKRLFDQGILIKEIQDALPEAADKKKWPGTPGIFHRIEVRL